MSKTMKAMVYHGANDIRFEERPRPEILQPTDAVIRLTKTTICGTDLGIWKGKNPEIQDTAVAKTGQFDGRILGPEGIGMVEEVGSAIKNFKKRRHRASFLVSAVVLHVKTVKNTFMLTPK